MKSLKTLGWINLLLLAFTCHQLHAATGRGRSQPITIDVRVRPTVTSVSPQSGTTFGGTVVTIKGADFALKGMAVKFGSTDATNVVSKSVTQLTAKSPQGVRRVQV